MFIFTGAVFRIPWVSGVWVSVGNFRSQVVEGFLELYIMFFLFTLEYEKRTNTLHAVILNYVRYINKNVPLTRVNHSFLFPSNRGRDAYQCIFLITMRDVIVTQRHRTLDK